MARTNAVTHDSRDRGENPPIPKPTGAIVAGQQLPPDVIHFPQREEVSSEGGKQGAEAALAQIVKNNLDQMGGGDSANARHRASEAYRRSKGRAADTYRSLQEISTGLMESARAKSLRIKNEQPLHFLALLGGTFFLAGGLLRLWRSTRHE